MDEYYYNLEEKLQTVWSTKQEWIPTVLSLLTILWKTTNYDFFNILRNLISYLNTIDEFQWRERETNTWKTHIRMEKQSKSQIFESLKQLHILLQFWSFIDHVNKVQSCPSFFTK